MGGKRRLCRLETRAFTGIALQTAALPEMTFQLTCTGYARAIVIYLVLSVVTSTSCKAFRHVSACTNFLPHLSIAHLYHLLLPTDPHRLALLPTSATTSLQQTLDWSQVPVALPLWHNTSGCDSFSCADTSEQRTSSRTSGWYWMVRTPLDVVLCPCIATAESERSEWIHTHPTQRV